MAVAVLLCARCGSHQVDVCAWRSPAVAIVRCAACANEARISGFTVGRVWRDDEQQIVTAAIEDAALPVGMAVR